VCLFLLETGCLVKGGRGRAEFLKLWAVPELLVGAWVLFYHQLVMLLLIFFFFCSRIGVGLVGQ
jgi:hypothetical protein